MKELLHALLLGSAERFPERPALHFRDDTLNYRQLADAITEFADAAVARGLKAGERIAFFLPKQFETAIAIFGTAAAGGVFVPVNPLLKPQQVAYILRDCNVRTLITAKGRYEQLKDVLRDCPDLNETVLVDGEVDGTVSWTQFLASANGSQPHRRIDGDVVSILYTSGSTGNPKGVVLSHRNMVAGAHSVAEYLENTPDDRLLAVLPLSFDYGLSQLTTAFSVGASVALMDYLLPNDVIKACVKHRITGLAAVPPLWVQLAQLEWPQAAKDTLRYFTNSGGHMPFATLQGLRAQLPKTTPFLMYGLTEAFRSTFLPPSEVDKRPGSMGKAIPNAEIVVLREDGSECAADEPGELVHRGALVSLGYWNSPDKTAERFKILPKRVNGLMLPEIAVFSGDTVKKDADGFLYFIGRKDDMIKCSGNRISPSELEDVVYRQQGIAEVAALGIAHDTLGQAVVLVLKTTSDYSEANLLATLKAELPNFMQPQKLIIRDNLPRNPNGKIDRKALSTEYADLFGAAKS